MRCSEIGFESKVTREVEVFRIVFKKDEVVQVFGPTKLQVAVGLRSRVSD